MTLGWWMSLHADRWRREPDILVSDRPRRVARRRAWKLVKPHLPRPMPSEGELEALAALMEWPVDALLHQLIGDVFHEAMKDCLLSMITPPAKEDTLTSAFYHCLGPYLKQRDRRCPASTRST